MANKLGRVVTYNNELPFTKLHHPSIEWFCGITRQIQYFVSPSALDQWSPNITRWPLFETSFPTLIHITL